MKPLSRLEAAQELLIRRRAGADVLACARAFEIPGKPATEDPDTEFFLPVETEMADHHRLILQAMDETSRTRYGRLMILAPPGSAKSTYASVVFPSKYLGEQGGRKLILGTYGDDLARKMGRRTRSIVKQRRFQAIWGCGLSLESSAADEFSLTNGSEYLAGGLLTGLTGNRAHGAIVDDPLKGRQEANSETIRNKTWDAFVDDLMTRLIPGGWLVVINTRWHEDDPGGRILPDGWHGESGVFRCKDDQDWRVISLQARCETDTDPLGRKRGEYLWPQWFDRKHWEQFENRPRTWASMFQQIPTPADGELFKPENIATIDAIPAGVTRLVRGWDFGSTIDGDYTAGVLMGLLPDGRVLLADVARDQWAVDDRDKAFINTTNADGYGVRVSYPQDPGQAGKSLALYLSRGIPGFTFTATPESGDKVTRAEPLASQVNVGNVLMVRGDWNKPFKVELRMFPNGKFDDQVDAASRAYADLIAARPFAFGSA